jgi:O-antigen ligase
MSGIAAAPPSGNRLDSIIIFASVALLAAGVEIGGSVQPARVTIAVGLLWALCAGRFLSDRTRVFRSFLALAGLWIVWGCASVFWTPDVRAGAAEMAGIVLGIVAVLVLCSLSFRAPSATSWLRRGWVVAFCLTIPVACIEILNDRHLPSTVGQDQTGGWDSFAIVYSATTFGNRNTYAAFVVLAFPFVLWEIERAHGRMVRAFLLGVASAALAIVFIDATRLGAAAMLLELTAWFCLRLSWKSILRMALTGVALTLAGAAVAPYLPYPALRFSLALTGGDESIEHRVGLLADGLQFTAESAGLGIGAGGFSSLVKSRAGHYETGGQVDPHNVWIQVFSQYGIFVGLAFVSWLAYCAATLLSARRRIARTAFPEASPGVTCGLLLLLALPLNGLMNSAYLNFTFFWAAIGSIAVIASGAERWPRVRASGDQSRPERDRGSVA